MGTTPSGHTVQRDQATPEAPLLSDRPTVAQASPLPPENLSEPAYAPLHEAAAATGHAVATMAPVVQRQLPTVAPATAPLSGRTGLSVQQPALTHPQPTGGPPANAPVEIPIVARSVRAPAAPGPMTQPLAPPGVPGPGNGQRLPLEQLIAQAQAATPASGFTEVVLQREADAPPAPPPAVQEPAAHEPAAQPSVAGEAAAAPAAPVAAAASSPLPGGRPTGSQLEELAQLLYEPISARIRAELWLDRERAGLMVDLRR